MNKLILLTLFVCSSLGANELTFVCDNVNSSSDIPESLVINTKDAYLIFQKNKHSIYVNNETSVMAKYEQKNAVLGDSESVVEFDKVSGWLSTLLFYGDTTLNDVYKCKKQTRLMD
jgi:hypothetical protein